QASGTWRDPVLGLNHVDEIEPEPTRKIRPGVVIRQQSGAAVRSEHAFPLRKTSRKQREKSIAPRNRGFAQWGRYPGDCFGNGCRHQLGISRIEPVMRVGKTMGMPVLHRRIEAASLDFEERNT